MRTTNIIRCFVVALLATSSSLNAAETEGAPSGPARVCGGVERAGGQAEILDPSRTKILEAVPRTPFPCESWASVGPGGGSLILRLREGYRLQLGPGSFVQIHELGDQVTLLKGHVMAESDDSSGELRVITPNGRARLKQGKMIVLYSATRDESQLIVVENRATFENRFEPDARRMVAKGGEATSLNFRLQRTSPTVPRAVSVAALRAKLSTLPVDEKDQAEALHLAHERNERKFPGNLEASDEGARRPASVELNQRYERNDSSPVDAALKDRFESKTVAGAPGREQLLYLRKSSVRAVKGRGKVEVLDLGSKEDQEKRRLVDELSRIHAD